MAEKKAKREDVESLVQTIRALPVAEQSLLLEKLFIDIPYPYLKLL